MQRCLWSHLTALRPETDLVLCQQSCVWAAPASVESGCAHRYLCIAVTLTLRSNLRQQKPDSPVSECLSERLSGMKIRDNETITVTLMLHERELWLDWFPVVCETPAITSQCENRQQVWLLTLLINNKVRREIPDRCLWSVISVFVLSDHQKLDREARICRLLKHPNIGE